MLAGSLKGLLVAATVALAVGATPVERARPPAAPAPHPRHRAPVEDDGCREIPPPARPLASPPPAAAGTCS